MEIIIIILLIFIFIMMYRQFVPRYRIFNNPWMNAHFAHRGLYAKDQSIPENSMAAFKEAIKYSYGIELDISLSLDDKCMVFHDDDLSRMCNINKKINELRAKDLKCLKLKDTNEPIPLLEDVLTCVNGQVPLMIELKTSKYPKKLVLLFKEAIKDYHGNYCVVSFDPMILFYIKLEMPEVLRGQIVMNFKKKKEYSFLVRLILHYSLLNFLVRPDFLSFHYEAINKLYKIHRHLKGFGSIWPLNSTNLEKNFQNEANCIIFEYYRP